jgi:hypothetical protein
VSWERKLLAILVVILIFRNTLGLIVGAAATIYCQRRHGGPWERSAK